MEKVLLSAMSDEDLFQLIKTESHNQAYHELYNRYWKILWRFTLQHQTSPEEAQDTLQDVFTYLWEKRESIQINRKVSSFLYRATLNQVLKKVDRYKFIAAYEARLSETLDSYGFSTEDFINEKELKQSLATALDHMPDKMRMVFEASRFEGLSHEEISQKYSISRETVKSQIKNALKILKKYIAAVVFIFF